jgi:hypothetical protein
MQQGRPLAFFSKNLGPKTAAKSVYEKEALAIMGSQKMAPLYLGEQSDH